jgi:O-antigen ligase
VIAASSLAAGVCLAAGHPLWPQFALPAFLCFAWLSATWPRLGILALPALLPVLDFAPWTGWLMVEEFDLLVLATLAGGYFRIWLDGSDPRHAGSARWLVIAIVCLIGWGVGGASMRDIGAFAGYATPTNALRVGKGLLWPALLLPLLAASRDAFPPPETLARFFWASLLGSVWVVLAIVWERAFFPGLLDIRAPYRTVGPFWEMNHGGAALDVYLVLIAPLLAWAWRRPLPSGGRPFLGLFILAFVYACLTTFSRGVAFAASGAVILHGLLHAWQARGRVSAETRVRPVSLLIIALVGIEIFLVFGTDSFMNGRLRQTRRDFGGRLAHWERALGALKSPADRLFGVGLGRFPSHRVQRELAVPLPGGFEVTEFADGARGARLSGPDASLNGASPGRFFAVSQRIELVRGAPYRFFMKARSNRSGRMQLWICASHLLYPSHCGTRILSFGSAGWQERGALLSGPAPRLEPSWRARGHVVFLASVLTPGAVLEISEMRLEAGGDDLLSNSRFDGARRWFPQSFHYFLPWHVDNLYLELLVETGVVGLLAFLCVVFHVFRRLFRAYLAGNALPIELLSSGAGVLALGAIVSVLDMPRVAALAGSFLVSSALAGCEEGRDVRRG